MAKTGGEPIFDMDTSSGAFAGAIGHKRGLSFLEFDGGILSIKKGISGAQGIESQTAVAYTSNPSTCISGSVKGEFYIWEGNTARRKIPAHQGSINSINVLDGLIYSSGNNDKSLIVWDEKTFQ
jgi:WD40 repeat protein